MDAEYFRTLYDYHYWARDRLLAAAVGMTEEEYGAPNGFTYNGLRAILTHTLSAEMIWLARSRGEVANFADMPREQDLPTLESLIARWAEQEAAQRSFLASLVDAELTREVVYAGRDGGKASMPLWQILTQVYGHGIQHRSEAAEALTMMGRSPGNLDFLPYLREKG